MKTLTMEMPEDVFAAMRNAPEEFGGSWDTILI